MSRARSYVIGTEEMIGMAAGAGHSFDKKAALAPCGSVAQDEDRASVLAARNATTH
jgi:hypothetical protein